MILLRIEHVHGDGRLEYDVTYEYVRLKSEYFLREGWNPPERLPTDAVEPLPDIPTYRIVENGTYLARES